MFKYLRNKNVLVTGHTGFKGSWLSVWLTMLGANVAGLSNNSIPERKILFQNLKLKKNFKIDLCDLQKVSKCINEFKPDFIFHLAAQSLVSKSYEVPLLTFQTNLIGTLNILLSIKNLKKNCITIFITSDKCYKNVEKKAGYKETDEFGGNDIYSASKASAEILINSFCKSFLYKKKNIKIGIGRAGNVIGGDDWSLDRVVPDCVRAWSNNKPAIIRSPNSTRPWQHVLEPLSGYLVLGEKLCKSTKLNCEAFNFGPKYDNTVIELVKKMSTNWNDKKYIIKKNQSFKEAHLLRLNCSKAKKLLDWESTLNFDDTAKFTIDYYKEILKNKKNSYILMQKQISEFQKRMKH